jgi:hypothetical protein
MRIIGSAFLSFTDSGLFPDWLGPVQSCAGFVHFHCATIGFSFTNPLSKSASLAAAFRKRRLLMDWFNWVERQSKGERLNFYD